MRFNIRPATIEAERWDGTRESAAAIVRWAGKDDQGDDYVRIAEAKAGQFGLFAYTNLGPVEVKNGDYVVQQSNGYVVIPARVFDATYTPADE